MCIESGWTKYDFRFDYENRAKFFALVRLKKGGFGFWSSKCFVTEKIRDNVCI